VLAGQLLGAIQGIDGFIGFAKDHGPFEKRQKSDGGGARVQARGKKTALLMAFQELRPLAACS